METKKRDPLFPSNYVTLRQLQERRLKEKADEEERLRRNKEEEEEKERLRLLEEEEKERRRKEEEEEEKQAKLTIRSKKPFRRNQPRGGYSRHPIAGGPPIPGAGKGDLINQERNRRPTKNWKAKEVENETPKAVTGSQEIALAGVQSPPEKAAGKKGTGRGASRLAAENRPPERTVEIERGIEDLKVTGEDKRRIGTAGARGGRNPGRGGQPRAPRGGRGVGRGMVWVRKTTTT